MAYSNSIPTDFESWFSRRELAAAIGVPDHAVAEIIKKRPADHPDPVRPMAGVPIRIAPATAQFVAAELGLSWPEILEKMRATVTQASAMATDVRGVVEGRVISQCPNPIFWRVRVGNEVRILRETRQNMRHRIKPGVLLRLKPGAGACPVTGCLEVAR